MGDDQRIPRGIAALLRARGTGTHIYGRTVLPEELERFEAELQRIQEEKRLNREREETPTPVPAKSPSRSWPLPGLSHFRHFWMAVLRAADWIGTGNLRRELERNKRLLEEMRLENQELKSWLAGLEHGQASMKSAASTRQVGRRRPVENTISDAWLAEIVKSSTEEESHQDKIERNLMRRLLLRNNIVPVESAEIEPSQAQEFYRLLGIDPTKISSG